MSWTALLQDGSIVLLVLVALATISIVFRTLLNGVAPMPTSGRVEARMIALVRELPQMQQQPHGIVVELGSGWGGLSRALGRAMPEATVIGYENSPVPFLFGIVTSRLLGGDNLHMMRKNFHRVSLQEADLVICYLSPDAMARLQPKLAAELKPSAIVVSSTFALPKWEAAQVVVADDMYRTRIYVYVAGGQADTPAKHINIVARLWDSDAPHRQ